MCVQNTQRFTLVIITTPTTLIQTCRYTVIRKSNITQRMCHTVHRKGPPSKTRKRNISMSGRCRGSIACCCASCCTLVPSGTCYAQSLCCRVRRHGGRCKYPRLGTRRWSRLGATGSASVFHLLEPFSNRLALTGVHTEHFALFMRAPAAVARAAARSERQHAIQQTRAARLYSVLYRKTAV
jgi:hypothetical protein